VEIPKHNLQGTSRQKLGNWQFRLLARRHSTKTISGLGILHGRPATESLQQARTFVLVKIENVSGPRG
jgi:hypothetical protein